MSFQDLTEVGVYVRGDGTARVVVDEAVVITYQLVEDAESARLIYEALGLQDRIVEYKQRRLRPEGEKR